ncbi:MAG TPA: sulfate/thiosulfate ABC transporter permease CysW, partial [Gammaproteobacteria bacterium]|nr:sulfate/thiosulfate ABC transporter permease CysW [Gammaproteobacteria bacterium]
MAATDHVVRRQQSPVVRVALIGVSVLFLAAILIMPVVSVLAYAFSEGLAIYLDALRAPDTLAAIRLTLTTAAIVVPANTIFGVAAAWAIA